jgi:hypothetical protein
MSITSLPVTAEDAARYDGDDPAPVLAVAGEGQAAVFGAVLLVRAANGREILVQAGQWVVRYAPGDIGVMDAGEYRRWFGDPAAQAGR